MNVVLKYSPIARRHRMRSRAKMLRALGPDHASMATWSAADAELHGGTIEDINRGPDARKWAHYLPIYESVVRRTRPVRMLEISSFYSDSPQMWREYLHPDSLVVSVDIVSKLATIRDPSGSYVRFAGKHDLSFLTELAEEFGPFDLIVDAGSLTTHQTVELFCRLFADSLCNGGTYLAEDVYCGYWMFFNRFSSTDIGRGLIDAIYGHYRVATRETNFPVSPLVVVRRTSPTTTGTSPTG